MKDSWAAYQLDLACLTLGRWVENKLAERKKVGTKKEPKWERKYSLKQLLDPRWEERQFGSPRVLLGPARKVKIKEDGTW